MSEKVIAKIESLVLPTYREPEAESLPMFAENRVHQRTSGNPYPNKIVARVDRTAPIDKAYVAVRLENEYVSVVILPELGGRIYSATDKTTGYDFFYKQHVIKPALIGVLGSWISGGVEFNWPFHHRASGYMACDYHVEELEDGSAVCHVCDHDPIDRMKGMVSIVLRPGERLFETRMRLYNRTSEPHSFLWWENAAVPVNEQYRIFFPQDVTYVNFHYLKSRISYPVAGNGVFNGIPMQEPRDISWHKNTREATSYFASASEYDFFGGYDYGKNCGVVHIGDHHVSPGKKMFTWAYGQLSKSWEKALTDTDGQYAELMAGSYSDNQPDFSWLAPYETKQFSQYWYPISAIGAPTYANLNCAFRIDRDQPNSALHLQVNRAFNSAQITVRDGETQLFATTVDLAPDQSYTFSMGEIPSFVTVSVCDEKGDVIAQYTERRFDNCKMPDPITDMPEAATMQSAQELYLAGVHVDQYRDPAVKPDAYWKKALERDIKHIPSLIAMANYDCKLGNLDLAESYARRASDALSPFNRHPQSGECDYVLGRILEEKGARKEAYDCYYRAAFAADCVSKAMTRVAVLDLFQKNFGEALRHAEWALDYGRNNALATAACILAERALGRYAQAEQRASAYLSKDPLEHLIGFLSGKSDFYQALSANPAQTCLDVCEDLMSMGCFAEAKRLLEGLLKEIPQSACRILGYVVAYLASLCGEEYEGALQLAEDWKIGPAFPNRPMEESALRFAIEKTESKNAKMLLGCYLYHRRRYSEAAELWENCPADYVAQRNLAVAYFSHLGRAEDALRIMKAVLAEHGDDEALLYETVVLMNKMNVSPLEKIDLIQSHRVTREDVRVELAKAYNQAGEYEKAIKTLLEHPFTPCEGGEHAIADQYMFAYLALGIRAYEAGDYEKALAYVTEGQTLPQSLGAGIWNHTKRIPLRYREALCLEALGRGDEAKEIYQYIANVEIEYFSNMHLPELPYYQVLAWRHLREELKAQTLVTEYRRRWSRIAAVKDNGFFATTPFFMPFIEAPERLRQSRALYLTALMDRCMGDFASANKKMQKSFALNNDNLFALLPI